MSNWLPLSRKSKPETTGTMGLNSYKANTVKNTTKNYFQNNTPSIETTGSMASLSPASAQTSSTGFCAVA